MSDHFDADQYIRDYKSGTARLTAAYGYNPAQEIDSCGVGLVVALDGKRRRDVVVAGIDALKAVWHRGAVDADGKTGDGAGIHVEIPQDFFRDHVRDSSGETPQVGRIAVGMVFLPRTDLGAQERCRTIVETEILRFGHTILGWRQVPVDISVIGEKANATRPEIEQILIGRGDPRLDNREFEKQLYILRRRMEKAALAENVPEFYVCSLSCRSVIYKGMFLAEHLSAFYPDLLDERFTSRFAIFHQRYSTNTFPQWKLAQPFRVLAHNGEINTLLGNVNWMKSHEARLEHDGFGRSIEDLKPIIQPDASDSSALDNVFELLVRGHRNLPMVKAMMIPEASGSNPNVPANHRAMYNYVNGVMEPWDGPAAIAAVAGKWALVGLDRNGLRPMRYVRTVGRAADRRFRGRHGAAGRGQDRREGPPGPGRDAGGRYGPAAALQGPRAQGHAGGDARLRQLDDAHRRAGLADQAGNPGDRAFRSRTNCAAGNSPPAGRSRIWR